LRGTDRLNPPEGESHGVGKRFRSLVDGDRAARGTAPGFGNLHGERGPMTVRPLHDRIIVKRIEEQEQKVGGIIIPDTAKEKPQQGKVIAVGKGKTKDDGTVIPMDVKEGDTILFGKYSGQEIKLDGDEFLIMREDEVLAVVA
jgi:chaperonin GroES